MSSPAHREGQGKKTARAGLRPARRDARAEKLGAALAALKESREQQKATAEILKVISRSPIDTQSVFRMIAESAARLCGASDVLIRRVEGDVTRVVAHVGPIPVPTKIALRPITRENLTGRAILERRTIHVADITEPKFRKQYPRGFFHSERSTPYRTLLAVPLVGDGAAHGLIVLRREEKQPFAPQQIRLLETFAAQAVIAIRNAGQFREIEERNAQLKQSLDFQGATGDILTAISGSIADTQPVFEAITSNLLRLFATDFTAVFLVRDEQVHLAAISGGDARYRRDFGRLFPQPVSARNLAGKVVKTGTLVHLAPIIGNRRAPRGTQAMAREFGYNAIIMAPMVREGRVIGAIGTARRDPVPFDDKQVALMRAFADQAVIAIENARLFNETKEALERQTATAEILKVIAASPSDVSPVFRVILRSATRLCSAERGIVFRCDGGFFQGVAVQGLSKEAEKEFLTRRVRPGPQSGLGRVLATRKPVHIADVTDEEAYRRGDPLRVRTVKLLGARTAMWLPLIRGDTVIGALAIYRREVRPFTEAQIDLVQSFADQAAIAIENVRLFNETKEALERQTATAGILQVISSTPTDAAPVFEAIVDNAQRVFGGMGVHLSLVRDGFLELQASNIPLERARGDYPIPVNRESGSGLAVLERRIVNIADVSTPEAPPLARDNRVGFRSLACAPLLRQGEPIGVISISRKSPGALDDKQIELLRAFADQAVIAIENARLFNETKEALERQTATAEILKVISSSPTDTQPVFDAVCANAARLCDAYDAVLWKIEGDMQHLVGHYGPIPIPEEPLPVVRENSSGRAILTGQIVHVDDLAAATREFPGGSAYARRLGFRTALTVPLLREGRAIGALQIRRREIRPFAEKQIQLLKVFADQAAIAIENVRLFNETKEALERQTASGEVLRVISGTVADPQPVFEAIATSALRVFGAFHAAVALVEGGALRRKATAGPGDPRTDVFALDRNSTAGNAVLTGRVYAVADTEAPDALSYARESGRAVGFRAVASAPMLREGKALGVVTVMRKEPGVFSEKQLELLQTFADQAVIAIENARLFNETKEALEQRTATSEILGVISSSPTDVLPVFDAIVASSKRLLGAHSAAVMRLIDGRLHLAAFSKVSPEADAHLQSVWPLQLDSDAPAAIAARQRKPYVVSDTEKDSPPAGRDVARARGYRSMISVPMLRGGETIGIINVSRSTPGSFSHKDVALLQTFANQAVIAIENARLFNETNDALERQTATAEILKVISSSPTDVTPVLEAIAHSAVKLFAPRSVGIFMREGNTFVLGPMAGPLATEQKMQQVRERFAVLPLDPAQLVTAKAIVEGVVTELMDTEAPDTPEPGRQAGRIIGYRSQIVVPLIRSGVGIGAITLVHPEPHQGMTTKELELVKTFADQAVIAIENTRLFNETKEALEQQTASNEVLRVISTSPNDIQPVFDAVLQRALLLCDAEYGSLLQLEGDALRRVAASDVLGGTSPVGTLISLQSGPGRAVREKRTIHLEDVQRELEWHAPEIADNIRRQGLRTVLAAPLMRENKAIGAINIRRTEVRPFSEKQIKLLETFAAQAVIAIENVRLFNETKEALEQQTATADILKVISSNPTNEQPVFDAIVESAARLFGRHARIRLLHDGLLHMGAQSDGPGPGREPDIPLPVTPDSIGGQVFLRRTALQIADTHAPDAPATNLTRGEKVGYRALAAAPLMREDSVIGILGVSSPLPGALSEKQMALLTTFASQAVIAIENARLFREIQERNSALTEALEQQTATGEILKVISGTHTDVQPVFDAIIRNAVRLCDGASGTVFTYDGELLHVAAEVNNTPEMRELLFRAYPTRVTQEESRGRPTMRAILERAVINVPDLLDSEYSDAAKERARAGGYRALLAVPMMRGDTPIGCMTMARREAGEFGDSYIGLLKTFADQAVIAIENVRLFNELEARNRDLAESLDQQKASADILGTISGSIADAQPVFDKIVESCARLFKGYYVGIGVIKEDGLLHAVAYNGPNRKQFEQAFPIPVDENSATGRAIAAREVMHYPDVFGGDDVPANLRRSAGQVGGRSVTVAPMLWEGRGVGGVFLAREFAAPYSDKEIRQLKTFADQAVIAIQNARLFREIQEKSAQLEVANKHKSDFLANMSHELRTPLNAIIGFSEVLMEKMFGEVNDKQADYLKDIHESGRHLLSLINDILDLSKIEAGRMELELSSFHLPTAISNAMTLIRERAQRHGIQLGTEVDPRLGEFQGDERKLKQILLNLLSNAVKFTPDGGRVDVSAKLDTTVVEIAVRDTGVGIAPEDQGRLFEEFRQVGRDVMRKAEGTGLGLALTKKFVELHGGGIRVESAPGKGSTFRFTLPVR